MLRFCSKGAPPSLCLLSQGLRQLCSAAQGSSGGPSEEELPVTRQIIRGGLNFLRSQENLEQLRENMANRGCKADADRLISLHQEYTELIHQINHRRHERNMNSKIFHSLKMQEDRLLQRGAEEDRLLQRGAEEEKDRLIQRGAELKRIIKDLEARKQAKEKEIAPMLELIPNDTHPEAPIGGYDRARVVHIHGDKPTFSHPVRDHVEIGERLGILDFHSGAQVTGHSFYYLKRAAAMLELALVQYTMQKAEDKGFQPIMTPDIVKTDVVEGCGFHPRGLHTQVYSLASRHGQMSLSGTAEVPLAGMFINTVVAMEDFPVKLVAFGHCFRAESGGYGQAVRGLYRVHQFSKVELFGVTPCETGKESGELLDEFVELQREIVEELGLHYRLLDMPTEDLGTPAYRKYDIEVWMPGRNGYGEVTSASNCTDFQSRRLQIKYRNPNKQDRNDPTRKYAHTVNATACAVPRTILALLETHQQQDGSVAVPEVLRPFLPRNNWHIRPPAPR